MVTTQHTKQRAVSFHKFGQIESLWLAYQSSEFYYEVAGWEVD